MSAYPKHIADLIHSPNSVGKVSRENAVGTDVNFSCGCFVRFSIRIDEVRSTVENARFRTNGCGYMVAAAELFAGSLRGKLLIDLHGLDDDSVFERIDVEDRADCIDAVKLAAKAAFNDYRSRKLEEFTGEKALICTCFGISEQTIEQFVAANLPKTAEEVAAAVRAGSGCGSCRILIQEIIDSSTSS